MPYTNYYISRSGNDATGDGSLGNPWKSLQKGLTALTGPGTRLIMRGGVYNDPGYTIGGYSGIYARGCFPASGSAAEPIELVAYPGETPVIDSGFAGGVNGLAIYNKSYINVIGIEVRRTHTGEGGGVYMVGAAHCNVLENHIWDIDGTLGCNIAGVRMAACTDCAVEGNHIHKIRVGGGASNENGSCVFAWDNARTVLKANQLYDAFNALYEKRSGGVKKRPN